MINSKLGRPIGRPFLLICIETFFNQSASFREIPTEYAEPAAISQVE